jgi:cob(I)alamin adenosyltransferase
VSITTAQGDGGETGLLYGGRVPKDDLRTEAYGSLDEAISALGLAR